MGWTKTITTASLLLLVGATNAYGQDGSAERSPTGQVLAHFNGGYNNCDGWLDFIASYGYVIRTARHCFEDGAPQIERVTWRGWGDDFESELSLDDVYFRQYQSDFHRPEAEMDAAIITVTADLVGKRQIIGHVPTPGVVEFHDVVEGARGQQLARVRYDPDHSVIAHLKYTSVMRAPHTIASGGGSGGMVLLDDGRVGTLIATERDGDSPFAVINTFTNGDVYEPAYLSRSSTPVLVAELQPPSISCENGVETFLREGFNHSEFWSICR